MKWIGAIFGIIAVLLGGLWLLQGTGLVVIQPIACIGACEAVTGPNLTWVLAGAALLLIGAAALWFSLRRR